MKIGITCYPTYGGSGVVATELGKALAARGHEIHFISYAPPFRLDHLSERIYFHEVRGYAYPLFEDPSYPLTLTSKMVNVVKFEQLDLLHVHYAIPHATSAVLARQILATEGIHIPVITTLHGTDATLVGQDSSFAPVVTYSVNQSDGVTVVSDYLKEETERNFKVQVPIEVIPNFVDVKRFRRQNKDHFKKAIAPNGERILLHTSNFRKVKRIDDVILVFKKVYEQIPSKLLLIGDGPERYHLETLCRQIGLSHEVRFLGKQDAIEELLAIADLFLIPSESESFGLAALEAMACEVPVISTNVGGLPEVNIHGETGFLSNVGDVEDMARNAIKILSNDDVLQQFRHNALQQAKRFDISLILPQYEAYYEEVLRTAVITQ